MDEEFDEYLAEQLENEDFRKEYDALEPEFTIIQAIIDARKSEGLTQKKREPKLSSRYFLSTIPAYMER